jgi:hypothetical protein
MSSTGLITMILSRTSAAEMLLLKGRGLVYKSGWSKQATQDMLTAFCGHTIGDDEQRWVFLGRGLRATKSEAHYTRDEHEPLSASGERALPVVAAAALSVRIK